MRFSIILPTRGRLLYLKNLFKSLDLTTFDKSNLEINVGIDNDDDEMQVYKNTLRLTYRNLNINFYSFPRSENLVKDFHNELAKRSKGEYIIVLCDDCEFETEKWDEIAYEKLNKEFCYGLTADGDDRPYTAFPIVSREIIDRCGYIFDDRCYVWGADVRLWMLFDRLKLVKDLRNISIVHNSYHTGRRQIDEIGKRIEDINNRHPNSDDDKWINETIEKIGSMNASNK